MKLFVTVTLLVYVFACCEAKLSDKDKQSLQGKFGTCMQKNSLDQQKMGLLLTSKFSAMDNDNSAQCFIKCLMDQTKFIKDDKINEEKIKQKAKGVLEDNEVSNLLKCKHKPADGCRDEYDVYKCFFEKVPKLQQLLQGLQSDLMNTQSSRK